jgi:hypothetical protein
MSFNLSKVFVMKPNEAFALLIIAVFVIAKSTGAI